MRENVNWEMEKERQELLYQLYPLIREWEGEMPNLRDIFRTEEIDWLLVENEKCHCNISIDDRSLLIRFVIGTGYKDEPDIDENGKPLLRRPTAVHRAARLRNSATVRELFKIYHRFDVNYTDELGFSHFHVACMFGLDGVVERFLELGQDPDCLTQESSPVDPPLHLTLRHERKETFELLLRRGADPNSTDAEGSTPLHVVCRYECYRDLATILFEIGDDEHHRVVRVDVRNKLGNTPLHHALSRGRRDLVELLLRRGADRNIANAEGSTPLHVVCSRSYLDEFAEMIFDVGDGKDRPVLVDPVDKSGRTPLKLAVTNHFPHLVDVLLDRGADLSNFVFPTEAFIHTYSHHEHLYYNSEAVFNALKVLCCLEKRRYKLNQSDKLLIMKTLAMDGLLDNEPWDYEKWISDDYLAKLSKKLKINPKLSFYDFIRLPLAKAEKLLMIQDYDEFKSGLPSLPLKCYRQCVTHLCETAIGGFYRRWALDFFLTLTRYQLPILCCEIIIGQLRMKDVWGICLAATGQN
ncbi:unnamed protein product [Trichogramma brassicae]|uniref:Uncharacterized protein n=1 Tax=Trichogramma brassicae TaxID=86971 RepID=A0A6H5HZ29_9HYME|nr:unnamed protein product [Trichogramma brassicae]